MEKIGKGLDGDTSLSREKAFFVNDRSEMRLRLLVLKKNSLQRSTAATGFTGIRIDAAFPPS